MALSACSPTGESGPVSVAIMGDQAELFADGMRLSPAAQHLRASINEGLVALDADGEVVPALAERWIVTDDGLSYIFRLRKAEWPDGDEVTSRQIEEFLRENVAQLEGTSLGLDLAKITNIRAMTGRVVELRLSSPMPEFLRLLAQPELGFAFRGRGSGPMVMSREEETDLARLSALSPETRGLPAREDWEAIARRLTLRALSGQEAVDAFTNGEIDLLMGGTLATFPMARPGPLSRGAVQVDPALGLFGLAFRHDTGLLADPARREALSMAIDRDSLIGPFNLGGWTTTSWIVPPENYSVPPYGQGRWDDLSLEERRAVARRRIAEYSSDDGPKELRVALPEGPGSDLLFSALSDAWQDIGITAVRAQEGERADVELLDRIARFASPRWYLNQLNCSLNIGLCSPEADALVEQSLNELDLEIKEELLVSAHQELINAEVYIPLGAPVRWSLVRGAVSGYQANRWGLHPLFPLSQPPT